MKVLEYAHRNPLDDKSHRNCGVVTTPASQPPLPADMGA
jgi:hypothetical protein